jgi:uncharacterized membrane protein
MSDYLRGVAIITAIYRHNLKILGLISSDSGMFQCVGINNAGSIQASVFLEVIPLGKCCNFLNIWVKEETISVEFLEPFSKNLKRFFKPSIIKSLLISFCLEFNLFCFVLFLFCVVFHPLTHFVSPLHAFYHHNSSLFPTTLSIT